MFFLPCTDSFSPWISPLWFCVGLFFRVLLAKKVHGFSSIVFHRSVIKFCMSIWSPRSPSGATLWGEYCVCAFPDTSGLGLAAFPSDQVPVPGLQCPPVRPQAFQLPLLLPSQSWLEGQVGRQATPALPSLTRHGISQPFGKFQTVCVYFIHF